MVRLPLVLLAGALWLQVAVASAQGGGRAVIVAPVVESELYDRIEALGTLEANESVVLTANVNERIVELAFQEGQTVSAGDLLVVLEQDEEQAMLDAALAVLAERQSAFDRTQQLSDREFAARAQLEERRAALQQAEAEVEIIQARLRDRSILAPFDGRIGLRQVSPGTLLEPGDPIATLSDISVLKLTMTVPSRFLSEVRTGLHIRATTNAFPDREFEGTIDVIDTAVDQVTRTITLRAVIANDDGLLRPGLLMTAELLSNPRSGVVVPEEALVPLDRRNFVFVVDGETADATVSRREVRIGTRRPGTVEIVEGLDAGVRVVVHGTGDLEDGDAVHVIGVADGETAIRDILSGG
ncbi:MAG: efflux RND transporter periplasmic adaptor subunit [Rhodospirillaceae bacterium]|nr:efflux RND transporter periplasmic adaptor subunit [Rhodospirillaceae bacterium]